MSAVILLGVNLLTFHYGAIEPVLYMIESFTGLPLTFHYGAIEPR